MEKGTVKFYMDNKGWGFIEVEGEEDIFFHHSEVSGEVTKGDEVTFEYGESEKGPIAVNVVKE